MKKIVYKKLIRDRIAEIIKKDGHKPKVRIMDKKEYVLELKKKVLEEAKELIKASSKEEIVNELSDLWELMESVAKTNRIKISEIKKLKIIKNKKRGGFKKKLFLEYVMENDKPGNL